MPSQTPIEWARSPAATRTIPLRRWLVAGESAVRGNAQLLGPRSVHPGSVPMTLEPVILSSQAHRKKKVGDQLRQYPHWILMWKKKVWDPLRLYLHWILLGVTTTSTSAMLGSIRSVVTFQNAWNGPAEKKHAPGSTTSPVILSDFWKFHHWADFCKYSS